MTYLQTNSDCQINENENNSHNIPDSSFPIELLRYPLDGSMRIVFTGYFNGFSVEVRSVDEMALLYHMGCFGKGTASRSKPRAAQNDVNTSIMRKRQFLKRNYWHKKFGGTKVASEGDLFLKEIEEFNDKIVKDTERQNAKDVIDLISSDEDMNESQEDLSEEDCFQSNEKGDIVVVVPNSDSENDDYFANLKPKCCLNRVKLEEKLMLSLPEAFFLLYSLGCLQIINMDGKLLNIKQCWDLFILSNEYFVNRYVVYHYFRAKGFVVKPGIKFGGDYLLYREGPGIRHADYIVVIKSNQKDDQWVTLLGHVRMAVTTVKEILIAEVTKPEKELNLPEELNAYSVREMLLNRKLPMTIINNSNE